MPFGCFGKRKKKEKGNSPAISPAESVKNANAEVASPAPATVGDSTDAQPAKEEMLAPVEETVTVARTQSLNASAPNSVQQRPAISIQKSATLNRYDFLRKSDFANTADRWAALKQQYLAPKMSLSQHSERDEPSRPVRVAQSLPRQFSPPSTVVSVVKFSQWFYERQIREEEAHQEVHEREERTRRLLDGESQQLQKLPESTTEGEDATVEDSTNANEQQQQREQQESQEKPDDKHNQAVDDEHQEDLDVNDPQLNEAATKIQAGFKGMHARKEVEEMQKHHHEEHHHEEQNHEEHHHEEQNHEEQYHEEQYHEEQYHEEQLPDASRDAAAPDGDNADEEANAAAAKIQAGFKGYMARKEMGLLHDQNHS